MLKMNLYLLCVITELLIIRDNLVICAFSGVDFCFPKMKISVMLFYFLGSRDCEVMIENTDNMRYIYGKGRFYLNV